jgi:hypothetical protein
MDNNGWESLLKFAYFGSIVAAGMVIAGAGSVVYLIYLGANSV